MRLLAILLLTLKRVLLPDLTSTSLDLVCYKALPRAQGHTSHHLEDLALLWYLLLINFTCCLQILLP